MTKNQIKDQSKDQAKKSAGKEKEKSKDGAVLKDINGKSKKGSK
ncbi:hypothetical protein [Nitrincola sp. MINF-07-Sa-05]